jgi:hypothetical protein
MSHLDKLKPIMMYMKKLYFLLVVCLAVSCGKDNNDPAPDAGGSDFGKVTSTVIIVNPKINRGSTTTIASGTQREGVTIKAGNLAPVAADATGLAVIRDLPTGSVPLQFSNATLSLNVVQAKELYDMVVSYTANGTAEIIPAVRYPIGGTVIRVKPGDNLANAVSTDGAIVFMEPGTYDGDVQINAEGVLLFGSWDIKEGSLSVINGNLTIKGGNARMRGVTVTGMVTVNANGYAAAFCEFNNANITGNSVSLLRNIFSGTSVTVPSSSAVLLDNENIP